MDLQTQKIEFIQEFLKIHDENVIKNLRKYLSISLRNITPMTINEFNDDIEVALQDSINSNVISANELKNKYSK